MDFSFDFDKFTSMFKNEGGGVSYWKVLGGAATAVAGAVVLPVVGPFGTVTVAGAAIASALGGLGGAAASYFGSNEKSEGEKARDEGFEAGKAHATAEHAAKLEKLKAALTAALQRVKEREQFFNLVVALHAVGVACAASDGHISENEARDIREFVTGLGYQNMPEVFRKQIEAITMNPPNVDTAFELARSVGVDAWDLFDEVISLVSNADGAPNPHSAQFRAEWGNLRQAA